jgi:hypothetical protein
MKARYFKSSYFKAGSGKVGLTWPEAVDHALCYGRIDATCWTSVCRLDRASADVTIL